MARARGGTREVRADICAIFQARRDHCVERTAFSHAFPPDAKSEDENINQSRKILTPATFGVFAMAVSLSRIIGQTSPTYGQQRIDCRARASLTLAASCAARAAACHGRAACARDPMVPSLAVRSSPG